MKDFDGNELKIGDIVAVIYHPQAYEFSISPAIVKEVKGNGNTLFVQLVRSGMERSFRPDGSGEKYLRVVKIKNSDVDTADGPKDALKHLIHIGDKIACMKPIELGNTVKGFDAGEVTKITEKFVFYTDKESGKEKRKAFKYTVVY